MNELDVLKAKREAIRVALASDLIQLAVYKVECAKLTRDVVEKEKAIEDANARIREFN